MAGAQHRKFDQGMNQDEASQLLGEGFVYSARNFLFDKIGIARKRGGITGLGATATYDADQLGAMITDQGTMRMYARARQVSSNALYYVNPATGALTGLTAVSFTTIPDGRPFTHYGFMGWPGWQNDSSPQESSPIWVGGATGAATPRTFTTPASIVLTAGDKRVTCAAADSPTTLMEIGQIIEFIPNGGPITYYVGRVTKLISTTSFEVYPTPGISMTGAGVFSVRTFNGGGSTAVTTNVQGAKCGMSFQGRVCLGNISREIFSPNRIEIYPRRVIFSTTLLEGDVTGSVTRLVNGAHWLSPNGYPDLNYFDVPAQEAVTAMTPTGFGDALIFTAYRTYRLTGNLTTQFGTEQSVTWAPREIPNSVGCMSERSMQRTPRGVVFAHDSGIYTTDGSSMQPLMYERMQNYWNALASGTSFEIYGSALIRGNHYYLCGVSGGVFWALVVNLDTLAWGTIDGKATTPASWIINSSAQDPSNPTRAWGLKYQAGSGVSMTGGQLVKLDDMFRPTSANRADSDTTTVTAEIITRPYTEDSPGVQKVWQDATITYNNNGGTDVRVTPGFVLESADLVAAASGFTNLDQQDVLAITAASNATPIVITTAAHNIRVDTWVRVSGVTGNTAANGPWRVQAVTGTTITLMGSIGNGAYVSGGTVRAMDQRDISLLAQARGAQTTGQNYDAVAYRVQDTAGSDSFELIAITHTWENRGQTSE